MKKMNAVLLIVFVCSILLISYGYVSRSYEVYFFWESKALGWGLLLATITAFLIKRIKARKQKGKKSILEIIGVIYFGGFLLVELLIASILPLTNAYTSAKNYLNADANLKKEMGTELTYSLLSSESSCSFSTDAIRDSAEFHIIVKGQKKFMVVVVSLTRERDSKNWETTRDWEYEAARE